MKIGIMISDAHYPYHNKPYLKSAIELCNDLKPEYFIKGGDMFDAYYLSKYAKADGYDIEEGIYKTHEEILAYKKNWYEPIKNACAKNVKVFWCGGNHDEKRVRLAIKKVPGRKQLLNLKAIFPEIKIVKYNKMIKIGKFSATHGTYCNDAHAKKHAIQFGRNIHYGHLHTIQTYSHPIQGTHRTLTADCVGCACELELEYMDNKPNGWRNAITVIYFADNGDYTKYVIPVHNGKFIFNGKQYG